MSRRALWQRANCELVAKSLGELAYEEALAPEAIVTSGAIPCGAAGADLRQPYRLQLGEVTYRFEAWRSAWGWLRVRPESIERTSPTGQKTPVDAGRFFIDARQTLGMSELTLGVYLEEMHSTLAADVAILGAHAQVRASELAEWSGERVQSVLRGHPKLLLNKGRMGWGTEDARAYAPENEPEIRLQWLAVRRDHAVFGEAQGLSIERLCERSLSAREIVRFRSLLESQGRDPNEYVWLPVHPWQWDRVIQSQYAALLAEGSLVALGEGGDAYRPQISLRTLSSVTNPTAPDLKLSLSVLNTSAVRGIPARHIEPAPRVAAELRALCERDGFLKASGTQVLAELGGVSVSHPLYADVPGAPYRYHESLGAIWRESVSSHLGTGEQGILTGSLFHQDQEGASLIGAYIRRSGLAPREWLSRYFDHVVLPLYHLQLEHGIGLVAHGQNIVLRLRDSAPCGVLLKDFQGDLRVAQDRLPSLPPALAALETLPPDHLIHDLITGHLVTVLRFVSCVLEESDGFSEREFYGLLASRVRAYLASRHPQGVDRGRDLLARDFARVVLNPVRFRHGYGDSSARPKPTLGTPVSNPLCFAGAAGGAHA